MVKPNQRKVVLAGTGGKARVPESFASSMGLAVEEKYFIARRNGEKNKAISPRDVADVLYFRTECRKIHGNDAQFIGFMETLNWLKAKISGEIPAQGLGKYGSAHRAVKHYAKTHTLNWGAMTNKWDKIREKYPSITKKFVFGAIKELWLK